MGDRHHRTKCIKCHGRAFIIPFWNKQMGMRQKGMGQCIMIQTFHTSVMPYNQIKIQACDSQTKTMRPRETSTTHLGLFIQDSRFITIHKQARQFDGKHLDVFNKQCATSIWATQGESRKTISIKASTWLWLMTNGGGASSYPWFHYDLDDGNGCWLETENLRLILSCNHIKNNHILQYDNNPNI